jgi:hypothetical protein
VVAKAEHLSKGPNPRFVVTSLPAGAIDARTLYEDVSCARGEVENRIKEQQLDLFADRTSVASPKQHSLLVPAIRQRPLKLLQRRVRVDPSLHNGLHHLGGDQSKA